MKHYTIDTTKIKNLLTKIITLLSLSSITIDTPVTLDILNTLYTIAKITRCNNTTKKQVQNKLIELYYTYSNKETINYALSLINYIKDNKIIIVNND